ncbi:hypothetical protein BDR22DRAFT_647891 [Usnea florida]
MSRLFLRAEFKRLRSPGNALSLQMTTRLFPRWRASPMERWQSMATEYCTSLMARANSGKAKRRLFQGRGILATLIRSTMASWDQLQLIGGKIWFEACLAAEKYLYTLVTMLYKATPANIQDVYLH